LVEREQGMFASVGIVSGLRYQGAQCAVKIVGCEIRIMRQQTLCAPGVSNHSFIGLKTPKRRVSHARKESHVRPAIRWARQVRWRAVGYDRGLWSVTTAGVV
jgi:hypothetical protein